MKHQSMVKRFNGYYDKSNSDRLYYEYCEMLYDCYKQSAHLVFCNHQLLSIYFPNFLNQKFAENDFENKDGFERLIYSIQISQPNMTCYPYQFIERMVFDQWNLFRAFSSVLENKKVLAISPFSESIEKNFSNRHRFFKRNYKYPEFELSVYNTPITYSGLPDEFYPHDNWFQTLDCMRSEIAKTEFDFALLSCGSYALPLGCYIEQVLGRKAIYVGGLMQLYFGIMGRRYENPFFLDQINKDEFIYPVESGKFLNHVTITDQTAREAFGAYF